MKVLEPRIKELTSIIAEVGEAKKGMAFALDWQPQAGTVMLVNGAARGKPIAGMTSTARCSRSGSATSRCRTT